MGLGQLMRVPAPLPRMCPTVRLSQPVRGNASTNVARDQWHWNAASRLDAFTDN